MKHFFRKLVKEINTTGLVFGLVCVLLSGISQTGMTQSNNTVISGQVTAAETQQALSGTKVFIRETGNSGTTGQNGFYTLNNVSPGSYTLVFEKTGHPAQQHSIMVQEGQVYQQDAAFADRKSEQEKEANFTDALTSEQIDGFGDYSAEEALARIPGIQADRDGNINLRGAGYNSYYVTVNGQRMGTTGLGNRAADLSAISADMIEDIEYIKVLSPDMDADGLAGVINLKTHQPQGEEMKFSGAIEGGVNPKFQDRTGANGRAWAQFAGPISENLNLTMSVNYQRDQQVWELLGIGYGVEDFGSGNVDVVERISPGLQTEGHNRFGSNLQLNYDHSPTSNFFFHGMVNLDRAEKAGHQNSWLANGGWEDQFTTGFQGTYNYSLRFEDQDISQYTFQAGGQHLFDGFTLEYDAGWTQSRVLRSENLFPFEATAVEYQVDRSNNNRPQAEPIEGEEQPVAEDMNLREMNYIIDNHIDQKITGSVDVEIPFSSGAFKFGSSVLFTDKDANDQGAFSEYHYTYQGFVNLEGFEQSDAGGRSIFNNSYRLERVIDTDEALSFFQSSIPNMRLDAPAYYRDSEIYNYFANEDTYAAYGMASLEFGRLMFIGGVRGEHTVSDYESRKVEYNRFGQFEEASDTTDNTSYTNLFPNAQVAFQANEESSIRLAYSRSMARPDFNLLAPFELSTPEDTTIFRGNPGLDPVVSDNIDLYMDYAPADGSLISLGGYYKRMSNFIIQQTQTIQIQEGEYPNFSDYFEGGVTQIPARERSYANSDDEATLYGIEAALQQRLNFLPGMLSNFGIYANYTWSHSEYETGRGEETALPGQSPHVVNAALSYNQNCFSAQLSYHWSAELISELQDETSPAPSISNGQVYLDRYQDGRQDLSANVRFRLTEQFQLWANVYNLLMNEQVEYAHTRKYYPTSIYNREGIEFNLGVRVNL